MALVDWVKWLFELFPKLLAWAKGKRKQLQLNKRAFLLWPEFRTFIFDLRDYFENQKTVSFAYILQRMGEPRPQEEAKVTEGAFRQLSQRSAILDNWFFTLQQAVRIDDRRMKANVFVQQVTSLNHFLNSLGNYLFYDLNTLLRNPSIRQSRGLLNDYLILQSGFNDFLARYETFLKKCNKDLTTVDPRYFTRLE